MSSPDRSQLLASVLDRNGVGKQAQYDAKRLRKSFLRRTIDYNSGMVLQNTHQKTMYAPSQWPSHPYMQNDPKFIINMLPIPKAGTLHNISTASAPQATTKFIHTSINKFRSYVNVVRWTPEGRRLITGSASGEFTLWNGLTFNFETILQAHETSVRSMRWSHNDTWMLSGDNAGVVKYWQSNMNNLKIVHNVHKEAVRGISFSPGDAKFATCSDDKTVKIWSFKEGICENTLLGHGWDVKCVDWHPQKALLASGSKDSLIKLWDPRSKSAVSTLHGHKNTVHAVSWNQNGCWMVSGSRDQSIKVWDVRIMKEFATLKGHAKEVCSVAWHPRQEDVLTSGGSDGSIHWWSVVQPMPQVAAIITAHTANIWTMDWHPLGHILCTGSNDCATRFWTRPRPKEKDEDVPL